jgi:hypothetical protein
MNCEICNDSLFFPGMTTTYTVAQFQALADALGREPGWAVSSLQMQVAKGRFRTEEGDPAFVNLQMGAHLAASDWHLCSTCALAIGKILDADRLLGSMVGVGRLGW